MCIYRERKAWFQGVLEKDLASQTTKERVKFEQISGRKRSESKCGIWTPNPSEIRPTSITIQRGKGYVLPAGFRASRSETQGWDLGIRFGTI